MACVFECCPAQDDHEFLAAKARDGVAAFHVLRHGAGDEAQHLIACLMTPVVIEPLEVIDVAHQKRNGFAFGARFVDGCCNFHIEGFAVCDAGGIGQGFRAASSRAGPSAHCYLLRRMLKLFFKRLRPLFHRACRGDQRIHKLPQLGGGLIAAQFATRA